MKATALALPALVALLAACSRNQPDPAPAADPVPTFAYRSQLSFVAPHPTLSAAYTTAQLTAGAQTTATTLNLYLEAASAEIVEVEVPLAALSPQWVGTYALRCPARPTDPADVTYVYYSKPSSWSISDFGLINGYAPLPLVGSFTVTAYDAARRLLSGTYTVQASHQLDPTDAKSFEYCDIALSGEFTDLKIK